MEEEIDEPIERNEILIKHLQKFLDNALDVS